MYLLITVGGRWGRGGQEPCKRLWDADATPLPRSCSLVSRLPLSHPHTDNGNQEPKLSYESHPAHFLIFRDMNTHPTTPGRTPESSFSRSAASIPLACPEDTPQHMPRIQYSSHLESPTPGQPRPLPRRCPHPGGHSHLFTGLWVTTFAPYDLLSTRWPVILLNQIPAHVILLSQSSRRPSRAPLTSHPHLLHSCPQVWQPWALGCAAPAPWHTPTVPEPAWRVPPRPSDPWVNAQLPQPPCPAILLSCYLHHDSSRPHIHPPVG